MAIRAMTIVNLEQNIRASIRREVVREMHHQEISSSNESPSDTVENIYVEIDMSGNGGTEEQAQSGTIDTNTTDTRESTATPASLSIEASSDVNARDSVIDRLERQIADMSRENERTEGCCKFYRSNIVGHFVSGIMTGTLFVLIGVIFTVNSSTFPVYVGIILIVMGIAPCCLAINRYRYMRMHHEERRQAIARLRDLRRLHRRQQRETGRRSNIYSDLPPSYDNLGFNPDEDFQIDIELQSCASALSRSSQFTLPTYEEFMKKNERKDEEVSSFETTEEAEENDLNNNEEVGTSTEINNLQGETEEARPQIPEVIVHHESDEGEDQEREET